jgi:hypothetical protein
MEVCETANRGMSDNKPPGSQIQAGDVEGRAHWRPGVPTSPACQGTFASRVSQLRAVIAVVWNRRQPKPEPSNSAAVTFLPVIGAGLPQFPVSR